MIGTINTHQERTMVSLWRMISEMELKRQDRKRWRKEGMYVWCTRKINWKGHLGPLVQPDSVGNRDPLKVSEQGCDMGSTLYLRTTHLAEGLTCSEARVTRNLMGSASGESGDMGKAWWLIWSGRDKGAEAGKRDPVSDACVAWGKSVPNSRWVRKRECWDGEFSFP